METKKLSDSAMEVTETKELVTVNSYEYDFLIAQLARIKKQKEDEMAQRDAEIAQVENLIAEADKLGIKAKVAEPVEEPVEEPIP